MTDALPPPHVVDTAACTAEVHDQGAQVARWAPAGAGPVLYVSSAATFTPGRSIRGGVPVCWPWFGPGRGAAMEPAHGFVRTSPWEHVDRADDGGEVTLTHRITSATATSPHWPHPYSLELRSRLGHALELTLTTTNTGPAPIDLEEALHAYLAVGDVREATVEGLDGRSFFDKVAGTERTHHGPLTFDGETDAVFRTSEPVTVVDPVLRRRLVVTTEGAANVVVWNPWDAKAAEVPDIGAGEWTLFVCVEGANALDNAVTIAPGESHTMTYRLEVEPL
ncbi:D-hexose-6-phosphate mutarotase [Fodinibacter luteus]|uniref:Putative glucose-6-phosphate 1-epimerase n=1 Tax=Fodinibacter luteus TaxID=552064 RepID=A0ABP8KN36_9MICO